MFTRNTTWEEKKSETHHLTFWFLTPPLQRLFRLHQEVRFPGSLTPTAMVTRAPTAEMTMRVIPSGSPKARNSMIFGTQVS